MIIIAAILLSGLVFGYRLHVQKSCEAWLMNDERARDAMSVSSFASAQVRQDTFMELCKVTGSGIFALMLVEAGFASRDAVQHLR